MLSLDRMRFLVRKGLGNLTEVDLPDLEVDELLNMSLWSLSERFPFKEKECVVEAPILAGVNSYGVPNLHHLDALYSLAVRGEDGEAEKLARRSMDWIEQNRQVEDPALAPEGGKRGRPQYYTRWRNTIFLHPIPDKDYIIRAAYWKTVPSLTEGSVETPDLPRNWHEIVVEGAITMGHYYNEDYNLAQQAENFRIGHERTAINVTAKEERDSRVAGLQVLWDFPPEGEAG
jgi:hypothetical protein